MPGFRQDPGHFGNEPVSYFGPAASLLVASGAGLAVPGTGSPALDVVRWSHRRGPRSWSRRRLFGLRPAGSRCRLLGCRPCRSGVARSSCSSQGGGARLAAGAGLVAAALSCRRWRRCSRSWASRPSVEAMRADRIGFRESHRGGSGWIQGSQIRAELDLINLRKSGLRNRSTRWLDWIIDPAASSRRSSFASRPRPGYPVERPIGRTARKPSREDAMSRRLFTMVEGTVEQVLGDRTRRFEPHRRVRQDRHPRSVDPQGVRLRRPGQDFARDKLVAEKVKKGYVEQDRPVDRTGSPSPCQPRPLPRSRSRRPRES